MIFLRKADGEIINRARIRLLASGGYGIETSVFDGPFQLNINLPRFTTEKKARAWMEASGQWETEPPCEGGDGRA